MNRYSGQSCDNKPNVGGVPMGTRNDWVGVGHSGPTVGW